LTIEIVNRHCGPSRLLGPSADSVCLGMTVLFRLQNGTDFQNGTEIVNKDAGCSAVPFRGMIFVAISVA